MPLKWLLFPFVFLEYFRCHHHSTYHATGIRGLCSQLLLQCQRTCLQTTGSLLPQFYTFPQLLLFSSPSQWIRISNLGTDDWCRNRVLRTLLYLSYLIRFHSIDPKKAKKGTLQEWNCHVSATFLIDCCCKTSRHSQADLREIPGNFLGKTRKRSRRAPVRYIYISLSLSFIAHLSQILAYKTSSKPVDQLYLHHSPACERLCCHKSGRTCRRPPDPAWRVAFSLLLPFFFFFFCIVGCD